MTIDRSKGLFGASSGGPDLSWVAKVVSRAWVPRRIQTFIPGLGDLEDAILVVDTETTGLYPYRGHRPFLVGLGSTSGRWVAVETSDEETMAKVHELLANPFVLKVGHHWKFDRKMLQALGARVVGPEACTMLMTQLADNRLNSYALKRLAANLLREEVTEEAALKEWLRVENMRRKKVAKEYEFSFLEANFSDAPRDIVVPYLGKDLEYTAKVFFASGPVCARNCADTAKVEMKLIKIVAGMEERGVWADGEYFLKMADEATVKLAHYEREAHRIAGTPFDIQSNKQLADVMFKKLGLKCLAYTDKGNPKFDADTLPMYDHPLLKEGLLPYRKVKKLKSTYYEPLAEMALFTGGTIHSSFNQLGAKRTGRFSSSDPNLQNIPRKDKTVRAGFTCRPGFIDYYMDYSQIEMRIFAHYANDQALIDALTAGEDVHEQTAILLFGEEARGQEQLRFVGKTINFGIIYGMGARALRKQLRKRLLDELEHMDEDEKPSQAVLDIANISESGARLLLNKYFRIRPSAKTFMDGIQTELRRTGRIVDIFGRPYNVPIDESYKGGNYLVQGTAASVLKRAMVRVDAALRKDLRLRDRHEEKCHMANCVHDELKIEVPRGLHALRTMRSIRDLMEDTTSFNIPITCDVAVAEDNWAKKHEVCRDCVDGKHDCDEEKCYCHGKKHRVAEVSE